ncbi:oxidoreductase-like protein [Mycena maculata]|uniref:Oxidoreductase-like protein n=1 Tax=Mycena maculata TaxID=230809 RepID=A0AAD7HLH7_9AGAR|nr:oxidoreductase-like protein [Mycena maculata]
MLALTYFHCGVHSSPLTPLLRQFSSLDAGAIERLKNPARGGQNLSLRYRRLEQSLRRKEKLQLNMRALESDDSRSFDDGLSRVARTHLDDPTRYFRGFEIPQRPKPPESDECCMSGCAVCVYDLYEESLRTYTEAMANFRTMLTAAEIPRAAWPDSVRVRQSADELKKGVTLSAFEELEKSLKEKRATPDVGAPP